MLSEREDRGIECLLQDLKELLFMMLQTKKVNVNTTQFYLLVSTCHTRHILSNLFQSLAGSSHHPSVTLFTWKL